MANNDLNIMGNTVPQINQRDKERFLLITNKILLANSIKSYIKIECSHIFPQNAVLICSVEFKDGCMQYFVYQKISEKNILVYQEDDPLGLNDRKYQIFQIDISTEEDMLYRYQNNSFNPFTTGSRVYSFKPNTILTSNLIKSVQFLID